MKTFLSSKLSVFFAGTTLAFMLAFGMLAFAGTGNLHDSFAGVGKELLPDALAGFNTNDLWGSEYDSYLTWTHSNTLKADDTTAQTLRKLAMANNTTNYYTLTDINGDGLVDVLYHDMSTSPIKFGVYLNNGNLSFTWAYKCAGVGSNPRVYYGDCAG